MNERTVESRTAFDGRLLKLDVLDVELDSGRRSVREVVRHRGAVAVLVETRGGEFVLVRQFRKPVERELLETVAGTLDAGERPDECARREIKEETGYEADDLRELGVIYPAPGYTDEALHMYHALVGDGAGKPRPDEDEQIEVVTLSADRVEQMIRRGEIRDAKTLAAWLLWRMRGEQA